MKCRIKVTVSFTQISTLIKYADKTRADRGLMERSRSKSSLHNQVDLCSVVILKRQHILYDSFVNLAQSILYSTFILICTYVAPAF